MNKTNNPGSPKFAIPRKIADIALKYGKNVSQGIQKMEDIINGKRND